MEKKTVFRIILACFIIGVVIGMVSSVFSGGKEPFLIPYISTPDEEPVKVQEQESIHEEEGEEISTLRRGDLIRVFHDNKRNVTCWLDLNHGGISCIPDYMLSP